MNATDKERLARLISGWVALDGEIGGLQLRQNELKRRKAGVAAELVAEMKARELTGVDTAGGQIQYNQRTTRKPITRKALAAILAEFYPRDAAQADALGEFIMERRGESVKDTITHKKKP